MNDPGAEDRPWLPTTSQMAWYHFLGAPLTGRSLPLEMWAPPLIFIYYAFFARESALMCLTVGALAGLMAALPTWLFGRTQMPSYPPLVALGASVFGLCGLALLTPIAIMALGLVSGIIAFFAHDAGATLQAALIGSLSDLMHSSQLYARFFGDADLGLPSGYVDAIPLPLRIAALVAIFLPGLISYYRRIENSIGVDGYRRAAGRTFFVCLMLAAFSLAIADVIGGAALSVLDASPA